MNRIGSQTFKFGGFLKSSDFQSTEHLQLSGFTGDLSRKFLVLEQRFAGFDFESCFEISPAVNYLFCFQIVPLALQITCRLLLKGKCHAILLKCFICNYMHTQVFGLNMFFWHGCNKKDCILQDLEVTLKKQHTLIVKCLYCSLKKAWTGLILVSSGDGSCSDQNYPLHLFPF